MITVTDVSLNFDGQNLFSHVDLKFTPGNCYGVIGANGAGKSTFLRILSGELEPSHGEVSLGKNERMSVLKQDHYAYDQYTVLDTIIMGNSRLYEIMKEKEALYMKPDFSDEDGIRASELEGEFAEMNGWEAESEASRLIQGLGLPVDILEKQMETTAWMCFPSTGWKTSSRTIRAPSSWYPTTGTSSTMCVPILWTSTIPKSSFMWATTTSGMNPAS